MQRSGRKDLALQISSHGPAYASTLLTYIILCIAFPHRSTGSIGNESTLFLCLYFSVVTIMTASKTAEELSLTVNWNLKKSSEVLRSQYWGMEWRVSF